MSGEHFAVDEIGNCGELFVVGETLEQIASFIVESCGEHCVAVCVRLRGRTKRESMFLILNETEIPA